MYFIVDAADDGTATPHHGDGTRFDVRLTVRDVRWPPPPSFEKDILPILAKKCHDCHGADLQEAKLDLHTLSTMLRGERVVRRWSPAIQAAACWSILWLTVRCRRVTGKS